MFKKLTSPVLALAAAIALVACEPITQGGPEPGSDPASSSITLTGDDALILVASEDHGGLLVVDRASKELLHLIPTGRGATHVIELKDGLAVVTNRYDHTVSLVDIDRAEVVRTVTVGVEPYGIAAVDGQRVAVTLAGEDALALVNLDTGRVEEKVSLNDKDPRAVARLADGRFVVSHMSAGHLSWVDEDFRLSRRFNHTPVATDNSENDPDNHALHPNHLRTLTVSPQGTTVGMAHSQSNSEPERAPIGEDPGFVDEFGGGGNCGYSGCATELGAVVPSFTEVEVQEGEVVRFTPATNEQDPLVQNGAVAVEDCFDCGPFFGFGTPNPPNVLNPFESRFNGVDLNNPTAMAYIDGGHGLAVLHMGTQNLLLLRRELRGEAADVIGEVQVGHGATGLALSHDGDYAYVWNQFDGSITEVQLPRVQGDPTQTDFTEEQRPTVAEFREVPRYAGETFTVVEDVLDADVSLGRKLFHDATDGRISSNHAISCASCHPDGRTDNQVWRFTFGPRNTPQLGGGILDTAPFHWPGDVTTHRDLNTLTVLAFMGGTGLDTRSMDAIGAFIDTIPAAPSAIALQEGLTAQQQRGFELFIDAEVGCTDCHYGEHFTDNNNWNVSSRASFNDIEEFQTPVLHGLRRSAPYFHSGEFQTLRDLVFGAVAEDRMGKGSHLTTEQLEDLAAYLNTL